jgi:hypothetical protein
MIIRTPAKPAQDLVIDEAAFASTIGEMSELAELGFDLIIETHNLTLALARLEHVTILSEAADEEKEAVQKSGAKEFVKRIAARLVEYWNRFIGWIKHIVQEIGLKVFGPRKEWLVKNKAALQSKTVFGDAKAEIGSAMDPGLLSQMFLHTIGSVEMIIKEAMGARAGDDTRTLMDKVKAPYQNFVKTFKEGVSIAKSVNEYYIGESEEVALNKPLVDKMIRVAEVCFSNMDELKEAQSQAQSMVREAQQLASAPDEEHSAAVLKALTVAGPLVGTMIGAIVSANSRANKLSMAVLVRALGAGGRAAPAGAPAEEKPGVKVESSVLDAYF